MGGETWPLPLHRLKERVFTGGSVSGVWPGDLSTPQVCQHAFLSFRAIFVEVKFTYRKMNRCQAGRPGAFGLFTVLCSQPSIWLQNLSSPHGKLPLRAPGNPQSGFCLQGCPHAAHFPATRGRSRLPSLAWERVFEVHPRCFPRTSFLSLMCLKPQFWPAFHTLHLLLP